MKRSSRKKRLAKWSKLGLSLAAVTVLGGVVEPGGADFVSPKVYATEQADPALEARKIEIKTMIQSYRDLVGQIKALNPADYTEESWNKNYDGDVRIYLGAQSIATAYNDDLTFSSLSLDGVDSHQTLNELNATYMFGYIYVENSIPVLKQAMADLVPVSESVETPKQQELPYTVEWYVDGQYYDGYTSYINPGELYDRGVIDKGGIPVWIDFADLAENSPQYYEITYEKVAAGENYYRFDLVSKDKEPVPYTIELVDQDGQVLQTIQQSGVEGTEVSIDFPVISGYRVGKSEGFDSWTYGKGGTFRLVANKTVKVYYDKAPSIDSLIRPEQRVEYQKVFDTFHTTVLKAFEVYKKELGVDHIIRLTEDEAKFNQITQSEDLTTLQLELILVENLFNEPVGRVLTDQDIINAIGWTPEYWVHQIAYHKEITQKLEKAMANIAASKAIPTVPVDQSITIKAVYTEEQIEPGQKVDVLKEIEYTLKPGESVVLEPLTFEGWTSRVVQESQTVTYEEAKARPNKEYYFYYIEEGPTPTEKPIETPAETPTEKPAEQLVEKPTEQPVEKLVERPTASPTGQSASEKQATKQGDKEPAAPASQSKQATAKSAPTSQPQAKSLPATGEAHSVLHMTGMGLLGLAGLVVKRRSRKSS
ncbi:TPA: LPXTG cell wall anchor domain-containing protein [Streptococcus suis]|nr:LPXTG cell wall anchor domain-containing protein [Streptococcus suis]HEM3684980.1 LPXTG cell wall anchor domain-containing protein [Streptococcus suis]HEM3693105.1 LPXTG cell wall anchor domain-containing protein [Streptococcus suis]